MIKTEWEISQNPWFIAPFPTPVNFVPVGIGTDVIIPTCYTPSPLTTLRGITIGKNSQNTTLGEYNLIAEHAATFCL